jgi:hypothetical protein
MSLVDFAADTPPYEFLIMVERERGRAVGDDCRFDARPGLDGASSGRANELDNLGTLIQSRR